MLYPSQLSLHPRPPHTPPTPNPPTLPATPPAKPPNPDLPLPTPQTGAIQGNIFVPTEASFAAALSALSLDLAGPITPAQQTILTSLLVYHITIEPAITPADVTQPLFLTPVQGEPYTLCNVSGDTQLLLAPSDGAGLAVQAVQGGRRLSRPYAVLSFVQLCRNLNVYVIDGVINPCGDSYDTGEARPPGPASAPDRGIFRAPTATPELQLNPALGPADIITPTPTPGPAPGPALNTCDIVAHISDRGCTMFAKMLEESGLAAVVDRVETGRTVIAPSNDAIMTGLEELEMNMKELLADAGVLR